MKDAQGDVGPMGEDQKALVEGARKCVERIEELNRMVSRLSVPAGSPGLEKRLPLSAAASHLSGERRTSPRSKRTWKDISR